MNTNAALWTPALVTQGRVGGANFNEYAGTPPFFTWGGFDSNEAFLLDRVNLVSQFAPGIVDTGFVMDFYAWWPGASGGTATVSVTRWLGGTPVKTGTTWVNPTAMFTNTLTPRTAAISSTNDPGQLIGRFTITFNPLGWDVALSTTAWS